MLTIKVGIVMAIFCISSVLMQEGPSCVQFDFNDQDSILQFESCHSEYSTFTIQSYTNSSIQPYRSGSQYYLGNSGRWSCIRTKDAFHVDENTEIYFAAYLKSVVVDDNSFVNLRVVDMLPKNLGGVTVSSTWQEIHLYANFSQTDAQIEILAFLSVDAIFAIEYLDIVNSAMPEMYCPRTVTSSSTTANDTTPIPTETSSRETTLTSTETTATPINTTTIETSVGTTSSTSTQTTIPETTSEKKDCFYTEATKSPVEQIPRNIFNIYNFISYFNYTSKVIN